MKPTYATHNRCAMCDIWWPKEFLRCPRDRFIVEKDGSRTFGCGQKLRTRSHQRTAIARRKAQKLVLNFPIAKTD